ncbi:MAG: hypothetical protein ABL984_07325 [Pyrinomonadaceae bacterium]
MLKIFPVLFAAILFLPSLSVARQDLDRVFSQAIEAVGSEKDIARVRSISATADCLGPRGAYTTSIESFRNSKTRFEQRFSYKPEVVDLLVNGDSVWSSQNGNAIAASPMQRMMARAHEYQMIVFDFKRYFREPRAAGIELFEGRPNTKVSALNELGMTAHLFFDSETKRLNGYVLDIPNSSETVRNVFVEWKRVGHLMLPSVVKAVDNQGEWMLRFHTIRLNKANEDLLAVPTNVADHFELLRFHEAQKTAHLSYDADRFVEMFADKLTQIQGGRVFERSRAQSLDRFKKYFSSYQFKEWEDTAAPTIKISKDGTLAYKIVQKRVRGTYTYGDGKTEEDHTVFAWIEVWEKIDGRWKVTAIASTDRKGEP